MSTIYPHARRWLLLLFVYASARGAAIQEERCDESVVLRPLGPTGKQVVALFRFECIKSVRRKSVGIEMPRHFSAFPRSTAQIVAADGVEGFRLSLGRGRWDPRWGEPTLSDGSPLAVPNGAELVASFHGPSDNVDRSWNAFAGHLAGLYCASLNLMTKPGAFSIPQLSSVTVFPSELHERKPARGAKGHVRHAALGRETVCTENLAPWVKILPCGQKAGLAEKLKTSEMFSHTYHALTIEAQVEDQVSESGMGPNSTLRLVQTATMVMDYPNGWWTSFKSFTEQLSKCSAMQSSRVYFDLPQHAWSSHLGQLQPNSTLPRPPSLQQFGARMELDLAQPIQAAQRLGQELSEKWESGAHAAPLSTARYMLDEDGVAGTLVTSITNRDPKRSFVVLYSDTLPWYLRVLFHTLTVTVNGTSIMDTDQVWHSWISPAVDRSLMVQMELGMILNPGATIIISVDTKKAFLRTNDLPPDESRGLDLPAAAIVYQEAGIAGHPLRLYTDSLLLVIAIPDKSMPYNVITYVSTLIALAFGSITNVIAQRAEDAEKPQTLLEKIKEKIKGKLKAIGQKLGLGRSAEPTAQSQEAELQHESPDARQEQDSGADQDPMEKTST